MLLTFINLPFVIKIFVLSIFEWPFYTGFTACFGCSKEPSLKMLLSSTHCNILLRNKKIIFLTFSL